MEWTSKCFTLAKCFVSRFYTKYNNNKFNSFLFKKKLVKIQDLKIIFCSYWIKYKSQQYCIPTQYCTLNRRAIDWLTCWQTESSTSSQNCQCSCPVVCDAPCHLLVSGAQCPGVMLRSAHCVLVPVAHHCLLLPRCPAPLMPNDVCWLPVAASTWCPTIPSASCHPVLMTAGACQCPAIPGTHKYYLIFAPATTDKFS